MRKNRREREREILEDTAMRKEDTVKGREGGRGKESGEKERHREDGREGEGARKKRREKYWKILKWERKIQKKEKREREGEGEKNWEILRERKGEIEGEI